MVKVLRHIVTMERLCSRLATGEGFGNSKDRV
jgi:hypothetical protein